jgi:probable F420-dependent oxidoreductase
MTVPVRPGITVPFDGIPLPDQYELFRELVDLGYTDVWTAESTGMDAFTPLVLASTWAPELRLGTAIVPAFTRGPAALAQQVAGLCQAAPGRVALGIGTSSNVIVERWNGIPFEKPYQRVRDTLAFLRAAFAGTKVTEEYETFRVDGFRLGVALAEPPPLLVAALRPGMLRLAGRAGDGAIINWLSADDVAQVVPHVGPDREIVCRLFVLPTDDADAARAIGRRAIASYLTVPVYRAFHEWLGRGDQLARLWELWAAGDRQAAADSIPDEVVDDLLVWGPVERCREQIGRYVANGVTTTCPALFVSPDQLRPTLHALAP